MKFIRITTGNYQIVHGYDTDNREIAETVTVDGPMVKLVAIERIQSISEQYILVTGPQGRYFTGNIRSHLPNLKGCCRLMECC